MLSVAAAQSAATRPTLPQEASRGPAAQLSTATQTAGHAAPAPAAMATLLLLWPCAGMGCSRPSAAAAVSETDAP
jgi:hypothetical protein